MGTEFDAERVDLTDNVITVQWADGHVSHYENKYLRINCGCAECVEEWSQRKLLDPATVPSNIRAEDHLAIGRYAIQFLWSDAHYTGIYPLQLLRSLCQCQDCPAGTNVRHESKKEN